MGQELETKKMLSCISVFLLLLVQCVFAENPSGLEGCCRSVFVEGSLPKSGQYNLQEFRGSALPTECKDGCVYTKERRPNDMEDDPNHYCFALNDQYTAQCQDKGYVDSSSGPPESSQTPPITAEENFGSSATQIENNFRSSATQDNFDFRSSATQDNFGSSATQDNFGSSATQIEESFVSSATQSTQVSEGRCPDLSKVNVVDDQMYTVNIETFKEDKLTIEMVDAEALVKISLETSPNIEFANLLNGKWKSTTVLPAGPYLVKVAFFGRNDDGTIDEKLEGQKWESRPIIKTFYVGEENLCEGVEGVSRSTSN